MQRFPLHSLDGKGVIKTFPARLVSWRMMKLLQKPEVEAMLKNLEQAIWYWEKSREKPCFFFADFCGKKQGHGKMNLSWKVFRATDCDFFRNIWKWYWNTNYKVQLFKRRWERLYSMSTAGIRILLYDFCRYWKTEHVCTISNMVAFTFVITCGQCRDENIRFWYNII